MLTEYECQECRCIHAEIYMKHETPVDVIMCPDCINQPMRKFQIELDLLGVKPNPDFT